MENRFVEDYDPTIEGTFGYGSARLTKREREREIRTSEETEGVETPATHERGG